jgi:hypothetical protein
MQFIAIYSGIYILFLLIAKQFSGAYPYPFLWALELPSPALPLGLGLFWVGVFAFLSSILFGMHWLVSTISSP